MKTLTIIFFLFLGVVQGQIDTYYPLPESNAIWNYHYYAWCGGPDVANEYYSIVIGGDTVINGFTYHKLLVPSIQSYSVGNCPGVETGYKGAYRQDTSMKMVYFVPPFDDSEQLLYDFKMEVGDTVSGYTQNIAYNPDIVLSIDSVLVGSDFRKRWNINENYYISIIEGIGSTYGLIEQSYGSYVVAEEGYEFNCFSHYGVPLYPDSLESCDTISFVQPRIFSTNEIEILPNPTIGRFRVNLLGNDFETLTIYDLAGNIIHFRSIRNLTTIHFGGLEGGLYILEVRDTNGNRILKKFSCL